LTFQTYRFPAQVWSYSRIFAKIWSVQPYVRKIATANTHDHGTAGDVPRPDGYWIGTEILFEGDFWGIDGWIQDPEWIGQNPNAQKSVNYDSALSELSHEQKTAILRMKYLCIFNGIYSSKIT
jgi:hypothetical protein